VVHTKSVAQQKLSLERGTVNITSNAELEVIKANTDVMRGVIEPNTNRFAFIVTVASFHGFNNALQREHFNEKYMESEKYPNASFTGKIIEQVDWEKDGVYEVRAKGDLDIHGQSQVRIIKCKVTIKGSSVQVESDFLVPLADHNIEIPRIIDRKIATQINVSMRASMVNKG
jgi:polyisoprenoid-binding protein YceI